jgi:serine/threonine protein kinase
MRRVSEANCAAPTLHARRQTTLTLSCIVITTQPPSPTHSPPAQDFCECGPVMTEAEYHTPLHPEIARAYLRDVLMGLEYLHFQRVIHR